ncbi:MAG: (Fe-S)-binding protein [Spirochaetes bacterium]|nr:(Fe-S)-binding protein [Spirochaetota bacterium]
MKENSTMFSGKARKNADACRFCWMCRHLCPVGLATGRETNTPRVKGLMVSLVERGYKYTAEMAADMYECCLCEACTHDCATGFEPPLFIREARARAVAAGIAPPLVEKAIANLLEADNIYGAPKTERGKGFEAEARSLPEKAPVALRIGAAAAYRRPEIGAAVIRLLKAAGVEFCLIRDELQTGSELGDLMGSVGEVKAAAQAAVAQINATGAGTLVVLDPSEARTLIRECGEWSCAPKAKVVTATAFIAGLVREGRLKPSPLALGTVTFHDPCRLARDLEETGPARELIAAMGLEFREMFLHGPMTTCCGGIVLGAHSPKLTALTAARRRADAARTGASVLVTACPGCLDVLGGAKAEGMAVEDIFVLLARACGLEACRL